MKLQHLIERYIDYRETLGERFKSRANTLRAFGRAIGPRTKIADVRTEQVDAFLTGTGPITSAWHIKHSTLLGFFRYATSRGYAAEIPLPTVLPKRPPRFVPYIYSRDELRRILDATGSYQRQRSPMEPITVRTIVLLLYGAGLRVSEVIRLDQKDVDLRHSVLTVRLSKFHKTRLVPFGRQVNRILTDYAKRDVVPVLRSSEESPFFTTRAGTRVNQYTLEDNFQRVRVKAGIRRSDSARYQPRLHDLRHSFAVHRLTSWYQQGADVQRLIYQLSVYLGHLHLADTQTYLSMTPELLREASARFERYAGKGGNHD
jgi:site-specific recombinase XerD